MSLPNTLTVSRIILTCLFILTVVRESFFFKLLALVIFCFASATDFLDGYLARKNNEISDFGKIMDPLADKFLMLTAFLVLVYLKMIWVWWFVLIFIREVGISLVRWYAQTKGHVLAAEGMGKLKTVAQVWTIFIFLLYLVFAQTSWFHSWSDYTLARWQTVMEISILVTIILTVVSGLTFLYHNGDIFNEDADH